MNRSWQVISTTTRTTRAVVGLLPMFCVSCAQEQSRYSSSTPDPHTYRRIRRLEILHLPSIAIRVAVTRFPYNSWSSGQRIVPKGLHIISPMSPDANLTKRDTRCLVEWCPRSGRVVRDGVWHVAVLPHGALGYIGR